MTMLLITLLVVIELGSNLYLHYFYHCDFEDSEIFKEVDEKIIKKLCLESVGSEFVETQSDDCFDIKNDDCIDVRVGIGGALRSGGVGMLFEQAGGIGERTEMWEEASMPS